MKRKFIIKETGEPIKFGEKVILKEETDNGVSVTFFQFSEDELDYLLDEGLVEEVTPKLKETPKVEVPKKENKQPAEEFDDYIYILADKLGWQPMKVFSYLKKLLEIYPAGAFGLLLSTIAKRKDKKYTNHISEAPEIWGVSLTSGKVVPIDKKSIKNYKHFAAFRTKREAEEAIKTLGPLVKYMYGE